jgi:hypothetical protein
MDIDFKEILRGIRQNDFKLLGRGSGRKVYDIGNGYVAKMAKNRKGFAQNEAEYAISTRVNDDLFAKILCASDNFRFVIMEKAEPIAKISYVWTYFDVKNNKQLYKLKAFKQMESELKLLVNDLGRVKNWGKINDRPVIVDYGFTQKVRNRYY